MKPPASVGEAKKELAATRSRSAATRRERYLIEDSASGYAANNRPIAQGLAVQVVHEFDPCGR